jgi:hypothetical protein
LDRREMMKYILHNRHLIHIEGTSRAPEAQMSALDADRQKKTKLLTVAPIAIPERCRVRCN